jgi:hypothetical protein
MRVGRQVYGREQIRVCAVHVGLTVSIVTVSVLEGECARVCVHACVCARVSVCASAPLCYCTTLQHCHRVRACMHASVRAPLRLRVAEPPFRADGVVEPVLRSLSLRRLANEQYAAQLMLRKLNNDRVGHLEWDWLQSVLESNPGGIDARAKLEALAQASACAPSNRDFHPTSTEMRTPIIGCQIGTKCPILHAK